MHESRSSRSFGLASRVLAYAFVLGVGLGALLFLTMAWMPTNTLKSTIDSLARGRSADNFPLHRLVDIQARCLVAGFLYLALAMGIWFYAKELARFFDQSRAQLVALCKSFFQRPPTNQHVMYWWEGTALFLIFVMTVLVRLPFLNQPLWCDESLGYLVIGHASWAITLLEYYAPNCHFLNNIWMKFAGQTLGETPANFRLLAFGSGILTPLAGYWAMRELGDRSAGLFTAAGIATSGLLVLYSTNARGYSTTTLCVCLAIGLLARLFRQPKPLEFLAFVLVTMVGFYSVPTMLIPYLGLTCWMIFHQLLFKPGQPKNLKQPVWNWKLFFSLNTSATLATLAVYTPSIVISGIGAFVDNNAVQPSSNVTQLLHQAWALGSRFFLLLCNNHPVLLGGFFLVGILLALACALRKAEQSERLLVPLAFLVGTAFYIVLSRRIGFGRLYVPLIPVILMTVGMGYSMLFRWLAKQSPSNVNLPLTVLSLVLAGGLGLKVGLGQLPLENIGGHCIDGPRIATFLAQHGKSTDGFLSRAGDAGVGFYLAKENLRFRGGKKARQVWVLVNGLDRTLKSELGYHNLMLTPDSSVKLAMKFSRAKLYLCTRLVPKIQNPTQVP